MAKRESLANFSPLSDSGRGLAKFADAVGFYEWSLPGKLELLTDDNWPVLSESSYTIFDVQAYPELEDGGFPAGVDGWNVSRLDLIRSTDNALSVEVALVGEAGKEACYRVVLLQITDTDCTAVQVEYLFNGNWMKVDSLGASRVLDVVMNIKEFLIKNYR